MWGRRGHHGVHQGQCVCVDVVGKTMQMNPWQVQVHTSAWGLHGRYIQCQGQAGSTVWVHMLATCDGGDWEGVYMPCHIACSLSKTVWDWPHGQHTNRATQVHVAWHRLTHAHFGLA